MPSRRSGGLDWGVPVTASSRAPGDSCVWQGHLLRREVPGDPRQARSGGPRPSDGGGWWARPLGDPRVWAKGRGRLGERSVGLSVAIPKGLALRSPPGRRRVRRAKACVEENLRSSCQGSRIPGKRSVVCREVVVVWKALVFPSCPRFRVLLPTRKEVAIPCKRAFPGCA